MSDAALRGVREMYDRDADAYAEHRAQWLRVAGERAIAGMSVASARLVLDVACGTGTGLDGLTRAAPLARVVGLDLSVQMLRRIRPREGSGGAADAGGRVVGGAVAEGSGVAAAGRPTSLVQGDASRLPFAAGVADAVLCCFALMHLASPAEAVAEFGRVLRVGGAIALATWGPDVQWPARTAVLAILDELGAPKVASSHHGGSATDSPAKLVELLRPAGFSEIRTDSCSLVDLTPSDAETALRGWSSLGSTAARLAFLDHQARAEYRRRALLLLADADPGDLADPRDVVYAWGRR